jgi:predicted membrane channel-forming protein YqfA (hemolysin III family)
MCSHRHKGKLIVNMSSTIFFLLLFWVTLPGVVHLLLRAPPNGGKVMQKSIVFMDIGNVVFVCRKM